MSLVPAFEIGVWNAWIPMLYLPLHPLLMILVDKAVGTGGMSQKMESLPYNKSEKMLFGVSMSVLLLLFIYSIFLPLKLGTAWFYAGLPIYLLGLIVFKVAIVNIATTPLGEPFTKGMYRYSRHPMGLGTSIMHIGISIASASWIFLLLSIVVMILPDEKTEERCCLERYGDAYREYMNRTPRWIGIPKTEKK